jgi:hypothetical protein
MTDDTTVKTRIRRESDNALRSKFSSLGATSGKRSNKQADDTTALTVPALLARADDTVFEPDYEEFRKGHAAAACDAKFDPRGNVQWVKKAEQLLLRVPEQLSAYDKGFLYAISRWPGPVAIPLRHRIKVCLLWLKLHDAEKSPW